MNLQERKEMIELIPYTEKNPYRDSTEQELLERLEVITDKIYQLEAQHKASSDRKKRKEIKEELTEYQLENSLVFQVLFKKYNYNVSADEVCELLDMDLHYLFNFGKELLFDDLAVKKPVRVTTGATQFIKDFIFKGYEYGLRPNPKTGKVSKEVLFFRDFHRKKLFFKLESVVNLFSFYTEVLDSRMFYDYDLSKYDDQSVAKLEINKFLLKNKYSTIVKKEIYDRSTRTRSTIDVLKSVNQPSSAFAVTDDIFTEKIILQTTSNFKETFIRNYCKASRTVHDQQLVRVLEQNSYTIEFVKLGIRANSSDLRKFNMRYFARQTELPDPNHYRIPLSWGTDTTELKQKLDEHLKEHFKKLEKLKK